jgi:tRNA(fMet)-specific endonuclease VapC
MNYLLDTCVVSELVARQPNPQVVAWMHGLADEQVYLSTITIGEIQKGIHKLGDVPRREGLQSWLEDDLLTRFHGRILSPTLPVMLAWGKLCAELGQMGRPLPAIDSLIAAIALHHNLPLATRNEIDFADTGVTLINPWG